MTHLYDLPVQTLQCYVTASYPCSYLEGQSARSQVVTPGPLIDQELYSVLVENGFRRSGLFTYRPHCHHCRACIPVRIRVQDFVPSRIQRRVWKRHRVLEARSLPLCFEPEHFSLYTRYQQARHREITQDRTGEDQYRQFLLQSSLPTRLVEFREAGQLRMVSLIDELAQGLSSVYTFYEPDMPGTSYGTYNILWQIEECRSQRLPWLYLGYWIRSCTKMTYKSRFQPLEAWVSGAWTSFPELLESPDSPIR